ERHVPVGALGLVEDRAQDVGRVLDVANRELLVQLLRAGHALGAQPCELVRVVVRAGDRLLEDRRIRRDASKPIFRDEPLELARSDERPPDVVVPDALAETERLDEWILRLDHRVPLELSIWAFAASTTASGVKPNFVCRSFSGADAPNVCIPIAAPVVPT